MRKDDVKKYTIEEDPHSGLELELQFMPRFFHDHQDAPTAPHAHEFYQIIWFRRGHGSHMVDFVNYPVSDNTIFFVAPGQIHAFDSTDTFDGVIIHFNASFMADEESSESVFLKYDVFNAYDSLPYYKVSGDEEGRLMQLVNEMNREYSPHRGLRPQGVHAEPAAAVSHSGAARRRAQGQAQALCHECGQPHVRAFPQAAGGAFPHHAHGAGICRLAEHLGTHAHQVRQAERALLAAPDCQRPHSAGGQAATSALHSQREGNWLPAGL